jgi:hypothetical protein
MIIFIFIYIYISNIALIKTEQRVDGGATKQLLD